MLGHLGSCLRSAENYALDVTSSIEDADPERCIIDLHDLEFLSEYFQLWDKQAIKIQLVLSVRCHRLTKVGKP